MLQLSIEAILNKITSTSDGGWRLTFDVSADAGESVVELSKYRDTILGLGIACGQDTKKAR